MGISRWSAAPDPGKESCDLLCGKRRIVGEVSELWVGKPRRHHSALNAVCDGGRPCLGLLVRHQRHGGDFTGPVATLAVVLEQRKNVSVESGDGFLGGRRSGSRRPTGRGDENQ